MNFLIRCMNYSFDLQNITKHNEKFSNALMNIIVGEIKMENPKSAILWKHELEFVSQYFKLHNLTIQQFWVSG